jgi:hypothetical protein
MVDALQVNKKAWNRKVSEGNEWTVPVSEVELEEARQGRPRIILTPTKPAPLSWLGNLQGRRVLGLASDGGQQGPLLAAAGADVTIVNSLPLQLERASSISFCRRVQKNLELFHLPVVAPQVPN